MQTIAILGSTGSIGTQALELVRLHPEEFRVVALTARSSRKKLFEQVREFRPEVAGLTEPIPMSEIPEDVRFCRWVMGEEALRVAAAEGNRLFKILSNSVIQTSSFSRHALRNAFLLAYQNTPFVRQ